MKPVDRLFFFIPLQSVGRQASGKLASTDLPLLFLSADFPQKTKAKPGLFISEWKMQCFVVCFFSLTTRIFPPPPMSLIDGLVFSVSIWRHNSAHYHDFQSPAELRFGPAFWTKFFQTDWAVCTFQYKDLKKKKLDLSLLSKIYRLKRAFSHEEPATNCTNSLWYLFF